MTAPTGEPTSSTATSSTATSSTATSRPVGSGAWVLVARREVVARLTDRTFLVSTFLTLALIIGFVVVQAVLVSSTKTNSLATTPADAEFAGAVGAAVQRADDSRRVEHVTVPDEAEARAGLSRGDFDGWLHRGGDGWVVTTAEMADGQDLAALAAAVREVTIERNAAAAGTTVADLTRGSVLTADSLDPDADPGRAGLAEGLSFAFAFLFYLAAVIFGMALATSVVEEKQSRVAEIIVAAIPIRQLLIGKIVGNTVLAFSQMLLYAGVGLIGLSLTEFSSYLSSILGSVAWFLGFFLVGFVALACLWAVAGALASRVEDLQSTTTPLTMLLVGAFFGAMFLQDRWAVVASFVPPVSAVVMPGRVVEGAPVWQPAVALLLLVAFAAAATLIGERIYRRALLQTRGRLGLRQAWRAGD